MKFTKQVMAPEALQEILDSPIPYADADEEKRTQDLFATLGPEDVEIAAQGSYAYWVAVHSDNPPTEEQKIRMAMREARRHLFRVEFADAVVHIKETCKYRKEKRIEIYRACFTEGVEFDNEADAQLAAKLRNQISADLKKQAGYVRGKDKSGRALLILRARSEKDTDEEEFVATQIYSMERAIAATEFTSRGLQEKIVVVLDFGTFKSSLAPSLSAIKAVASILQTKYSERLKNLVAIDPPLWMRTMYGLIKPFLDATTKAKFILATGDKRKEEVIAELVEPDQAMPFMLPGGKLVDEVDLDKYMKVVPFYCLYDEQP